MIQTLSTVLVVGLLRSEKLGFRHFIFGGIQKNESPLSSTDLDALLRTRTYLMSEQLGFGYGESKVHGFGLFLCFPPCPSVRLIYMFS